MEVEDLSLEQSFAKHSPELMKLIHKGNPTEGDGFYPVANMVDCNIRLDQVCSFILFERIRLF